MDNHARSYKLQIGKRRMRNLGTKKPYDFVFILDVTNWDGFISYCYEESRENDRVNYHISHITCCRRQIQMGYLSCCDRLVSLLLQLPLMPLHGS